MSEQQPDFPAIDLKPIVSYPREAQAGETYLMTIDVQLAIPGTPWPYPEEEYPISFILDTQPYFSYEPLDGHERSVVLHCFGGTYGPVQYVLTASSEAVKPGHIHITLINGGGLPIGHMELECEVTGKAAKARPRKTTTVHRTARKREQRQSTQQMAAASPAASAETIARDTVEEMLSQAGWTVQGATAINIDAAPGIAIREFPLLPGQADYLLVVNGEATGVIENKEGTDFPRSAQSVEDQLWQYQNAQPAIPSSIRFQRRPLPFAYGVVGNEIQFTNHLEPDARTRSVFHFHRPETLALWLSQAPVGTPNELNGLLRSRLLRMPPLEQGDLRNNQLEAIERLEASLAVNRPRTLIQMATGSGKTHTMVYSAYRLLRYGGARRILFLVDRKLLAYQTIEELRHYTAADTGRPFSEMYNMQLLENNRLDSSIDVCVTTIQRLYTLLINESLSTERDVELFDEEDEAAEHLRIVHYDPVLPIDFFDVIIIDECHRSIYSQWRSVLEYFDAFIIGYTSTLDDRAYAFFSRNLVYEYSSEEAINDGIVVPYEIYRIRTEITKRGSTLNKGEMSEKRDEHGLITWEQLTDDIIYNKRNLNRDIVAIDQIRTIIRAFKDALFIEFFPGRTDVPKTVIFAKDERHAEDIVQIVKEEFAQGNEFVQRITSRTTGAKSEQLIQQFRNNYNPRVAVTVSMLIGLDIKPLEIVIPMRFVKSRILQQQMVELGCRTISDEALQAVTPGARKNHCVVIDAVGMTEDIPITNIPKIQEEQISSDSEISSETHGVLQEALHRRFSTWLASQQQARQQPFTEEQILWLERIRDRISNTGLFTEQDFASAPFSFDGGLVAARHLFGNELPALLQGLNRLLSQEE